MWKWITATPKRFLCTCFIVAVMGLVGAVVVGNYALTVQAPDPVPVDAETKKNMEAVAEARNARVRAQVEERAEAQAQTNRKIQAIMTCENALAHKYRVRIDASSFWSPAKYAEGEEGRLQQLSGEDELPSGRLVSYRCTWRDGNLIEVTLG